ncbi:hypothetical protein BC829DRAFT_403805 [Chytridium lagenaria]|nr:hypothetical protein BC829DRAFT_403805 [Chytridium lagenaria]
MTRFAPSSSLEQQPSFKPAGFLQHLPPQLTRTPSPTPPPHTSAASVDTQTLLANPRAQTGFLCPLKYCGMSFTRRYNMIMHFRTHAERIGVSPVAVEEGCGQLKSAVRGCVPAYFNH